MTERWHNLHVRFATEREIGNDPDIRITVDGHSPELIDDVWLFAADGSDRAVGRCGDRSRPALPVGTVAACALPHGHGGWHRGDDRSEWTHGDIETAADAEEIADV